jgi:hypothetical protein
MGTLVLRVTPASTSPLVTGNLGVVVANRSLTTLENLMTMFQRFKAGAPSITNPGVANTTSVRCDVNPVAPTGTFTISSGSGTITAVINGVSIAITWATSDTNSAALLAAAINASTNALVLGLVSATSAAGVVTVTGIGSAASLAGNAITTTATGTGHTAQQARLTGGTDGTAQVTAVKASGTFTVSTGSGTLTAIINGQTVAITATGTDATDAAAMATAILASEKVGIRGVVTATSALGVVTVTAVQAGTGNVAKTGNGITTTATGTGFTAGQAALTGGVEAVSTRFTY